MGIITAYTISARVYEAVSPPTVSEQRRQWQGEACLTVATEKSMPLATGVTSGFTGVERCTTTHSVHYPKCYRTQIYITSHLLVLNICRDCVNLTEVPEGDWLCDQCLTTPAHLPLGGPPGNNTVPSEEGILVVIHR